MPRVSDLWELVWKRPSTGQMVNKRYPFRILLSNPSLLLHYKMQQLHPQQTAPSQSIIWEKQHFDPAWSYPPADFQEPSEFSHNHPNSGACNQHHNVISHFSFPSEPVLLNLIFPFQAIFLLKEARLLVIRSCLNCHKNKERFLLLTKEAVCLNQWVSVSFPRMLNSSLVHTEDGGLLRIMTSSLLWAV